MFSARSVARSAARAFSSACSRCASASSAVARRPHPVRRPSTMPRAGGMGAARRPRAGGCCGGGSRDGPAPSADTGGGGERATRRRTRRSPTAPSPEGEAAPPALRPRLTPTKMTSSSSSAGGAAARRRGRGTEVGRGAGAAAAPLRRRVVATMTGDSSSSEEEMVMGSAGVAGGCVGGREVNVSEDARRAKKRRGSLLPPGLPRPPTRPHTTRRCVPQQRVRAVPRGGCGRWPRRHACPRVTPPSTGAPSSPPPHTHTHTRTHPAAAPLRGWSHTRRHRHGGAKSRGGRGEGRAGKPHAREMSTAVGEATRVTKEKKKRGVRLSTRLLSLSLSLVGVTHKDSRAPPRVFLSLSLSLSLWATKKGGVESLSPQLCWCFSLLSSLFLFSTLALQRRNPGS